MHNNEIVEKMHIIHHARTFLDEVDNTRYIYRNIISKVICSIVNNKVTRKNHQGNNAMSLLTFELKCFLYNTF